MATSWDEYYLTSEQREQESERFKEAENPIKILIVVDMLLVGYDVPVVQVLYLDKGLREHTLLQAIARVNRPYDQAKTYELIVDYCGLTKELQKALAIFEDEDIEGALQPVEGEIHELKIRHLEAMSFFKDIDRNDDNAIMEKFEPINVRDEFEYAFKMFWNALEVILPKKEADPYLDDFKYAGKIKQMIRTYYEGVGVSLRGDGKKVQQLTDDHIRSLNISELMNPREITYDNFLSYISKFKSERARTALVKNKAKQVIRELAPNNPVYYEKLRERLEKLIQEEFERRRKDADYFNNYKKILQEALEEDKERKKLGFSNMFEFAVYEQLKPILKDDDGTISKNTTKSIFDQLRKEIEIVGWKTKTSSKKKMSIIIYDILTENKFPENKVDGVTQKIIDLAERNL